MKAFIIIPTLTTGGAERVAAELCNNWSQIEKKINVHLVLLVDEEVFYPINENVIIHKLNYKVNSKGFLKFISLLNLFFKLRKLTKKEKPIFVLSFMNKYNVFVLITLLRTGFKIIVSERDSPTEKIPKIISFLRRLTYKSSFGVLCQTKLSKEFILRETGNNNVIAIPNPIMAIKESLPFEKENIILNVGRLVDKKGQKYLLESFARLKSNNWKLVILGDGPLKNDLISLSESLNIADKVVFNGTTKNVDEWYQKSSIFAFTSILEGFPNALAEAMAYGLPCVSFDCNTGPREIINHGVNGFLTQEKDIVDFSDKLQMLIDDEVLREKIASEASKIKNLLNSKTISQLYLDFCMK